MSAWGTGDVAAALPDANTDLAPAAPAAPAATTKNPQDHGWVPKVNYAYDIYNKSGKEAAEALANVGTFGSEE